ncbi:MAG TPA: uroporphyrinogen-III synthase [Xanthobacteraceae bacterium]|jgi:uroporphyrinogen-III synthase|nr:uroporphyrinogen-III synthase [Xanthobacteraceae bacterium]
MRILITRPAPDAARSAAALRARGHDAIVTPFLSIEHLLDAELGAGPWSAILVTSANAAAIAAHRRYHELHDIPVLAVGHYSAQAMRDAGFTDVSSSDGDVAALASLVAARMKPGAALLYLAGAERSGDLAGALHEKNLAVHTAVIYRAVAAKNLPAQAAAALAAGIDGVLHYSRRSAEAYIAAARRADLAKAAVADPIHFCLSAKIAAPLLAAGATNVRVAAQPDEAALLALCPATDMTRHEAT